MANLNDTHEKFVTIYVRFFRHHLTGKLVFPRPPNTCIKLKIPIKKWQAYQDRKRKRSKKTAA